MPTGANAVTELAHEHAAIEQLVGRIAPLDPSLERTELLSEATGRFMTHVRAEERFLLPVLRSRLPAGEQEFIGRLKQLHTIRELVGRRPSTTSSIRTPSCCPRSSI
jgi:hypothetical protein